MRAIKTQLSIGLVLSLVVMFLLQWLLVSVSIRYLAEQYVASRLEHDTESLLTALNFAGGGAAQLDLARIDQIYQRPFSGHYYRITSAQQTLPSRSLWDQDMPPASLTPGAHAVTRGDGPQRQHLLIRCGGYRKQQHALTLCVAEDLTPIDTGLRHFQWRYAGVSLAALLVLLIVQYRVVRIGLQPLELVRRELQSLERGELSMLDAAAPEELRPLVLQINQLLETLSQRLTRSRHALGNLAHALKTPLTLLNQLADDERLHMHPELRRAVQAQLDALQRITERELKRARLAGAGRSGARVELGTELDALIDTLRRIYRDKGLEFIVRVSDGAYFPGDREDLLELLGNLLDNACKWARHQVRVSVESGSELLLRIEDDGPGCAPQELDHLAQRGVRNDEHTAGHGLGLSIVQEIVEQHGGRLSFGQSETLGGFRVEVVV
jgi:signal transduction histidine kinase